MSGETKHDRDSPDGESRLAEALAVHARYVAGEEGEGPAQLISRFPHLEDLLDPMLESVDDESDEALPAGGVPGEVEQIGDFRLIREIGRGGMGIVWEAEQVSLGRRVALKLLSPALVMDPTALARFRREASLAAALDHPAITKVLAFSAEPDLAFLAMELVDGSSLAEILQDVQDETDPRSTPPDRWARAASHTIETSKSDTRPAARRGTDVVVDWIIDVAEALHAAHSIGVVHRDVKPSNILIRSSNFRAVLTDFGLARESNSPGVTRTGEIAGTVGYTSPEQLRGANSQSIDARTDVFALGVTAYETLTFRHPFAGHTIARIHSQIESSEPVDPRHHNPDIDRDLAAVLSRALEKDPDHRYPTARAFAEDLQRWRRHEPVIARPVSTARRLTRWGRRNPLASGFLGFACVALIAVTTLAISAIASAAEADETLAKLDDLAIGERLSLLEREIAALTTTRVHADRLQHALVEAEGLVGTLPHLADSLSILQQRGTPTTEERWELAIETHPLADRFESLRDEWANVHQRLAGVDERAKQLIERSRAGRDGELRKELDPLEQDMQGYRRFVFGSPRDQLLHDRLEDAVVQLRSFEANQLQDLRRRAEWTRGTESDTHAQAWDACVAAVGAEPRFAGLHFGPQEGLVPLGPDPTSGLQEFAHQRTGVRIPTRSSNGALDFDEDCGIIFVLIPAGHLDGIHLVQMDREVRSPPIDLQPYFISKFEMSRRQWRRLAEHVPHLRQVTKNSIRGRPLAGHKPVIFTDWATANELMQREGLALPTFAQWLFAARANSAEEWWKTAGRVWPHRGTGAIDSLAPNPFGLHHVLGHVAEWCEDSTYDSYPGGGDRGRTIAYLPVHVRTTAGSGYAEMPSFKPGRRAANDRAWNLGLRPARALDQQ